MSGSTGNPDWGNEGETLRASITEPIIYNGQKVLVNYAGEVRVMPGESTEIAARRLRAVVITELDNMITAYYESKEA